MKIYQQTPYQNLSGDRIDVLEMPEPGQAIVWDSEHGVERFRGDEVEAHWQAHLIAQRPTDADVEYS